MINPSSAAFDVGREVLYLMPHGPREWGVLRGWNEKYAFVRFAGDNHAKAVERSALEWGDPVNVLGELETKRTI